MSLWGRRSSKTQLLDFTDLGSFVKWSLNLIPLADLMMWVIYITRWLIGIFLSYLGRWVWDVEFGEGAEGSLVNR